MRIFLDTNILLDVLAERDPHCAAATALWSMAETGELRAAISTISFNNIYYILRKAAGKKKAVEALQLLRGVFEIAALDESAIHQAIDSKIDDFEDAIQYLSAARAGADCFVTRDPDDFPPGGIRVLSADELLAAIQAQKPDA